MTDKEIIKEQANIDIDNLHIAQEQGIITEFGKGKLEALEGVVDFIDSMQEELISKDLEEASKEWLRPQLDKSYANYGEEKMMELTHFDGYAMLDAIEFGAKWKEHQMMKDAIDAERTGVEVNDWKRKIVFSFALPDKDYEKMNKVKVIIIKSE